MSLQGPVHWNIGDFNNSPQPPVRHFVVAIDFGTAYSSVAFVVYDNEQQRKNLDFENIEIVDDYQHFTTPYHTRLKEVPTDICYLDPDHLRDDVGNDATEEGAMSISSSSDEEYYSGSDAESHQNRPPRRVPANDPSHPRVFWGYGVQDQIDGADVFDDAKRISRFKLLLDSSERSVAARDRLEKTCTNLRKKGLINDSIDIICHYLGQLLAHTRKRLLEEGYTEDSPVEFVLSVPAVWTSRASRQMHFALKSAVEFSGLGKRNLQYGSINNLFIVSEPEAAATAAVCRCQAQLQVSSQQISLH
jgi:hypothetical protein